jgi:hypothetical protein
MAAWKGGGWRKASKGFAVPLTKLQIHALRVLAAQRSPDSYVGVSQGMAPRHFSGDIDILQDSEERLATAAEADGAALVEAGLKLSWGRAHTGKRQAQIDGLGLASPGATNAIREMMRRPANGSEIDRTTKIRPKPCAAIARLAAANR